MGFTGVGGVGVRMVDGVRNFLGVRNFFSARIECRDI